MINKVILIGNLGKDPEVRMTPNGQKVASFSIATSERFTDQQGNKKDKTEWHNVVTWGRLAEIIEKYVRKGSSLYIEGKLTTRSWDDQQGQKKYRTEIVASTIQMIGGKSKRDEYNQTPDKSEEDFGQLPSDEDLPF